MTFIEKALEAVRGEHLDGWLFFNFHGRDATANRLLGLEGHGMNTRPWYFLIPAKGEPVKIVHAIERKILDTLPGRTEVYSSRSGLTEILKPLAGTWAAGVSETLTVISTLDHGTARYLEGLGFSLVSSAALIQQTAGVLDTAGIASHEGAAKLLYECVHSTWRYIRTETARGSALTERAIQLRMTDFLTAHGLVSDHPLLVAAGVHSADPHYEVPPSGAPFSPGDIIQFDLWAKKDTPGSIYADISWVGILASSVPPEAERVFRVITGARDRAVEFVSRRLEQGKAVTGAEVDRAVRAFIEAEGYGEYLCHRTGHGIDTDVHGSGVNMDSVEFPDDREIIEGSCFSIEPGVYLENFGMRTEINAYRRGNTLVVSGGPIQHTILTL